MVIAAQILLSVLALTANVLTVPSSAVEKEQGSSLLAEKVAAMDVQTVSSDSAEPLQQGGADSYVLTSPATHSDAIPTTGAADITTSSRTAARQNIDLTTPVRRDTLRIHYRLSNSVIDTLYRDNATVLRTIKSLLGDTELSVDTLYIYSSSSPEGGMALNRTLSQKRGEALRDQLVNLRGGRQFEGVSIVPLGSNYDEFLSRLKSEENVPYKAATIADYEANIRLYGSDAALKRLHSFRNGVPYGYIARTIFPEMRYADLVLVSHIVFDEDIAGDVEDVQFDTLTIEDQTPIAVAPMELPKSEPQPEPQPEIVEPEPQPVQQPEPRDTVRWYPAIKTNLLFDLVTAVNAELEFPLGRSFSIAVEDTFPWWNWGPNGKKYCFQFLNIAIEPRWWFSRNERRDYLSGHFLGIYGMSGKYDFQWDELFCWQGEHWSAGFTYGYALPVCKWANMEFSVSAGFLHSDYRHYQPDDEYEHLFRDYYNSGKVTWFGPTKAKISLVIPLGKDSHVRKKTGNERNQF